LRTTDNAILGEAGTAVIAGKRDPSGGPMIDAAIVHSEDRQREIGSGARLPSS
jgi:hypothetical protein